MTAFAPGQVVVVVARYDDTLPDCFVGRLGIVKKALPYQGIGDDPKLDPVYEIKHGPSYGRPAETQIYWSDEIMAKLAIFTRKKVER